ncbi:hypothetical protein ACWC2K_18180 [Streptomyces chattanoogensis]
MAAGRVGHGGTAFWRNWLTLLIDQLWHAVSTGEIAELETDLTIFQLDVVLTAANIALRLGETDAVSKVRRTVDGFLAPPR